MCGNVPPQSDKKNDCGDNGVCDGTNKTQCICSNMPENGFWSGDRCQRCKQGYTGENCDQTDTTWREPTVTTSAAATQMVQETM
eukprot:gene23177-9506_t